VANGTSQPGKSGSWLAKGGKILWSLVPVAISLVALYYTHKTYDQTHTSDSATISVTSDQLIASAATKHEWTETINGAGFYGDSAVYIYYPGPNSLQQPQPDNAPSINNCPADRVLVELTNGNFTAQKVFIPEGFSAGTYNIYAEGVKSTKIIPYPITIGSPPPSPAPLSSPSPTELQCPES
jgi:hypothetical protein